MPTVFVIGANRGLGLEWARHYKAQGYDVIASARDIDAAVELKELLTGENDRLLSLDVQNSGSVHSAISQLPEAPDITLYNAGVKGYTKFENTKATLLNGTLTDDESYEEGERLAFEVNAFGFNRVMRVLHEKLLKKSRATVCYITSGVADTRENTGGGYPFYRQSKAAGESYAAGWDVDLLTSDTLDSRPRVFALVPGLVDTGMGYEVDGAVKPEVRVPEMMKVIAHVQATGDTFGVWKYDGTKSAPRQMSQAVASVLSFRNEYSDVKTIVNNSDIYKTEEKKSAQVIESHNFQMHCK